MSNQQRLLDDNRERICDTDWNLYAKYFPITDKYTNYSLARQGHTAFKHVLQSTIGQ